MALSYLAEIDSSLLEKAEFINILSSHEFLFDPHDLQRGQKLLLEEMGRIMNLNMASKEIDSATRLENTGHVLGRFIQESEILHKISNHPVHIQDYDGLSPSSFIPFCQFGENLEFIGRRIDQFDYPVCDSFKAKFFNDQLCYEIDLNNYKMNFSTDSLNTGFTFLVDNNEDRQFSWNTKKSFSEKTFKVYIETLGNL